MRTLIVRILPSQTRTEDIFFRTGETQLYIDGLEGTEITGLRLHLQTVTGAVRVIPLGDIYTGYQVQYTIQKFDFMWLDYTLSDREYSLRLNIYNNIKELDKMIVELVECYEIKKNELEQCPNSDSHRDGFLRLGKQAIEYFESKSKEASITASQDPTTKKGIISEFQKKADSIKKDINDIIC